MIPGPLGTWLLCPKPSAGILGLFGASRLLRARPSWPRGEWAPPSLEARKRNGGRDPGSLGFLCPEEFILRSAELTVSRSISKARPYGWIQATEGQHRCKLRVNIVAKRLGSGRAGLAPSPLPLGPGRVTCTWMSLDTGVCGEEPCLTCPNFHLHFSRQEKREPSAQVPNARSAPASRPTQFPLSWTCVRPWPTDPSVSVAFHPLLWESPLTLRLELGPLRCAAAPEFRALVPALPVGVCAFH